MKIVNFGGLVQPTYIVFLWYITFLSFDNFFLKKKKKKKKTLKSWHPHIGINKRKMLMNVLKTLVNNSFKESFYGEKKN